MLLKMTQQSLQLLVANLGMLVRLNVQQMAIIVFKYLIAMLMFHSHLVQKVIKD